MIILLPLFNSDFWIDPDTGVEGAAFGYMNLMTYNWPFPADTATLTYSEVDVKADDQKEQNMLAYQTKDFMDDLQGEGLGKMLRVRLPNDIIAYYTHPDFESYRIEEMNIGVVEYEGDTVEVYQDNRSKTELDAILNVIRTFYICFLLLGGSALFSRNTYNLVIKPIESMTEKVIQVIERPQKVKEMAFIKAEEDEAKLQAEGRKQEDDDEPPKIEEINEAVVVEDAVRKIGILLGVGLGEAGSSLIGTYLSNKTEGADSEVLMKNVVELDAIFGFCDIRNFTDATEVLQEEVMVFVNTVGGIVHTIADRNLGAANKNIGDAFLIVWKIPHALMHESQRFRDPEDKSPLSREVRAHNRRIFNNLADLALFAILKMYAEINRSYSLVKYVNNEKLKARIGKNYKVKLGFGLHYGWAIEGAIGSFHKVDVSYLSPNVNMASWLEGNTKDYGVALLVSGEFYDLLTPEVKRYCRKIDCLGTTGSPAPLRVYTPNISDKAFEFPKQEPLKQHVLETKECYTFKKLLKSEIIANKYVGPSLYENDVDIRLLMCRNNPEFIETFAKAFDAFEKGNWKLSHSLLKESAALNPEDNPTKKLLHFIDPEGKGFPENPPENWEGFRPMGSGGH